MWRHASRRVLLAARPQRRHLKSLIKKRPQDDDALLDTLRSCTQLYETHVAPTNDACHGPLERNYQPTMLPFVLLLGNHSSGKSSFANYALGRRVQQCGVAPTDDGFTVIAPGEEDADQDGPALASDPDLGFEGLQQFGPGLVQHAKLKLRTGLKATNFCLIDSPGMIDAPGGSTLDEGHERGYNFEASVRWFADRADVILLFFDPDKPGTTGETLSVLTNALSGCDHKLHIILNKADRFEKIHDFARAYGALCWNLSKVIPRKDLPRIYTTCIPPAEGEVREGHGDLANGLEDLRRTRDDVMAEVFRAPTRRVDNAVTRLRDAASVLLMHLDVCSAARRARRKELFALYAPSVLAAAACISGAGGLFVAGAVSPAVACGAGGLAATAGLHYVNAKNCRRNLERLDSQEGLDSLYRKIYAKESVRGDGESLATWHVVRQHLLEKVVPVGGAALAPAAPMGAHKKLQKILDVEAPRLRRQAAPATYPNVRHDDGSEAAVP